MKRKLSLILVIMLAAIFCLTAYGCDKPNEDNNIIENKDPVAQNDDDYILEIEGISAEIISVTKAQIKALAQTKPVEYTQSEPCYSSDKTDDDGNPEPHWLKGVYLDDILAEYAGGAVSGYYSAMVLQGTDGYDSILTQETYSIEHGGSKMIVAYEYDGNVLTPTARSGALRAIFPDQVANSWAKMLKKIIFSDAQLSPPAPTTLNFIELLGDSYNGSFTKEITTGAGTSTHTFYGISLKKLIEADILTAEENDKMYMKAWDYITDGTNSFNREYTNWKSNEYYADSYLVYSYKIGDGQEQSETNAPAFDGANILKGMTVKNVLSLSVKNTALVSLDMAYDRYDIEETDEINFSDVLGLVNMMNETRTYTITDTSGSSIELSGTVLDTATLENTASGYLLHYGAESLTIKSISINK